MEASDLSRYHERTREKGVNMVLFWIARVLVGIVTRLYFSLERPGRKNIPKKGAVILAANHRSFLDPFVIGCCLRRPVYFVAKRELFNKRWQGWILNRLGAFPIKRGEGDEEAMATARHVLERGAALVMFPEGTRHPSGPLGRPKRGIGRLALQTGAPVVPIAVIGTERARRGWMLLPVWVRVRCGKPLRFPHVERPSPRLAQAVTTRVWPCVELQWNWLGGDQAPAAPAEPERKAA